MLNWLGVRDSFDLSGYNLIIHEVAHKLDARGSGYADGVPAIALRDVAGGDEDLHAAMSAIQEEVNLVGENAATIDACAASFPAECFAVLSEYLFSAPDFCCLNASRHCITVSRSSTARTRFNACLVMTYSTTLAIDIVD